MGIEWEHVRPEEIEKRSFEIIGQELEEQGIVLDKEQEPVIKRCIHTSADFEYARSLAFSEGAVGKAIAAIKRGASIITDTNMVKAGINKNVLAEFGGEAHCFVADADIREIAERKGITRSAASVDKAAELEGELIFAVGNAPTALIRIHRLIGQGKLDPAFIIGVPVGFVNVVQSKELIMEAGKPFIAARGRKGGSNIAACICNALLYMAKK